METDLTTQGTQERSEPLHVAYMDVGIEWLRVQMNLPPDARIVGVEQRFGDRVAGLVRIYVEHPNLPEVPEATPPPEMLPVFHNARLECGHYDIELEAWGVRE